MANDETPLEKWRRIDRAKNYRPITRGPRKGQLTRKSKAELQRDRAEECKRLIELERERQKKWAPKSTIPTPTSAGTRTDEKRDYTVALVFPVVIGVCLLAYFAMQAIGRALFRLDLGWLFLPIIFVDFFAWQHFAPKGRHRRYLPLLWWFFD